MVDETTNNGAVALSPEAISDAVTNYAVTMCKVAGNPLNADAIEQMRGEKTANNQAFESKLNELGSMTKNQLVHLMNNVTPSAVETLFDELPPLKDVVTETCRVQNVKGARSHV